ncbi:MAG: DMT family transporter [Phycisphaerales bacterium JB063]
MPKPNLHLRSDALLLITAAIWGTAFVFQEYAVEAGLQPFAFNAMRFALGGAVLLPLVVVMRRRTRRVLLGSTPDRGTSRRAADGRARPSSAGGGFLLLLGGGLMGVVLAAASALQQAGLGDAETTAGKGGFITGLYVVLVPVLGMVVGRRTGRWVWVGVGLALVGLFLLSINLDQATPTMSRGDGLVLTGTLFWAVHILLIDHFSKRCDALMLSVIQFFIGALLCAVGGWLLGEQVTPRQLAAGWHAIAYCGVMAVAVAYTLQVVAQRGAHPTAAAVILSSEVLFAALGGAVLLGETMPARGYLGCGLMLAGMLISQLAPGTKTVVTTPESA